MKGWTVALDAAQPHGPATEGNAMTAMIDRSARQTALPMLALILLFASPAAADWIGPYFPLWVGNTWTYENVDVPGDTFTDVVFDATVYDGNPAVLFGQPDDYNVIGNTGLVITVYAQTEEGVLVAFDPYIVIGEFDDGDIFEICVDAPCDSNLIRDWDAIDPVLRSFFHLDASYDDLIMLLSFDRNYAPNLLNAVAVSNLPAGATPPAGAVTSMEWYQRGLGMIAITDVDAQSGGLEDFFQLIDLYVGVDDRPNLPSPARLAPNFPNPFNPGTTIPYALDRAATVRLEIRDVAGRLVRTLVNGRRGAGEHTAIWDGGDDAGRGQASGVYFAHLEAGGVRQSAKLVLIR